MAIDKIKAVEYVREKYPHMYGSMSEHDVLNHLQNKYSHLDWGVEEPIEAPKESPFPEDIDSPGILSQIATWSATDALADDYDWAKRSYNNSTAGAIYKTIHGKNKHEVDEMPNEWWEDAAGFFLGMTNPIEAMTFIGTAGVGGVAGKMVAKKAFGEATKRGLVKAAGSKAKDKVFRNHLMKESAVTGGLSLGGFSAASGAIHRYGEQALEIGEGERDDYDHWEITKGVGEDFLHGAILGAAGGIVTSPMATKFARASRKVKSLKKKGTAIPSELAQTKILNSPFGQVLAESQVFTAGQISEQAIANGEMPSADDWWKGTFSNLAIIGGMKAGSKIYKKAFTNDTSTDVENYYKSKKSLFQEAHQDKIYEGLVKKRQSELDALKNVEETLLKDGGTVPEEILKKISEIEMEANDNMVEQKDVRNGLKRIDELRNKSLDEEVLLDLNRLTEAERGEFGHLNTSMNLWMIDFYDTLQKNPEIAREWYKNKVGKKELTEAQIKTMDALIKSKSKGHIQVSEMFNDVVKQQGIKELKQDIKEDKGFQVIAVQEGDAWKTKVLNKDGKLIEEQSFNSFKEADVHRKEVYDALLSEAKQKEVVGYKEGEPLVDKSLPLSERRSQLEKIGLEKGMPIDEMQKFKEKSVFTKENPEGWDMAGLESAVKGYEVPGSGGTPKTKDFINATVVEAPFSKIEDKPTKKRFNTHAPSASNENKQIIAKIIDGKAWKTQVEKTDASKKRMDGHLNQILKYTEWLQKNKDGASIFTDGKIQLEYIKEYLQGKTNNQQHAILDGIKQLFNKSEALVNMESVNIINSAIKARSSELQVKAKGMGERTQVLKTKEGVSFSEQVDSVRGKVRESKKDYSVGKKGDKLENREVDLLIEIMEETAVRPEDFSNIRIVEGENKLRWQEKKKEGRKESVDREITPELYEKIIEYMNEKGYTAKDVIMETFRRQKIDAPIVNKLIRDVIADAGEVIEVYTRKTGNREPMTSKNKKGLQEGRVFRTQEAETIFGGDTFQLEAFSSKLHDLPSTAKRNYIVPMLKSSKLRGKQKATDRLPEEIRFKEGDTNARDTFAEKVMKKNNLTEDSLKQVGLSKTVLGEWGDGIIKLQKGEWQPSDFYHENLHRLKEFSNLTGNKKLQKIIAQGERLAKGTKEYKDWKKVKANQGRNIEEFLADIVGGKADRIEFANTKGMLPKVKQFVNRLISTLKTTFGMGNFKDYSDVLARKVQKGFETEGVKFGKEIKQRKLGEFSTDEIKVISKTINDNISHKLKDLNAKSYDKEGIINHIADVAKINTEGYKKNKFVIMPSKGVPEGVNPAIHYENLKQFESTLKDMNIEKIKRIKDVNKWFDTYKTIDNIRINEKGVTDAVQKGMLESFGVKDGDIWRASQEQLNDYKNMLHTLRTEESTNPMFINEAIIRNNVDPKYLSGWEKLKKEAKRAAYPVYKVLEGMGLKPLSKLMKSHFGIEAGHLGNYDSFINDIKRGHTSSFDGKIIKGTGERGFDKMKDSMAIALSGRGERYLENMEMLKTSRESLSSKEIKNIENADKFFKKAIKSEWFKEGGDLKDFINRDTVEGRVAERYVEYTQYYPEMFDKIARIGMNPAQYERFIKEGNVQWIKDGIFITQQTTNEFKKLVGLDSKAIEGILDKNTNKIARELAKETYETKNPNNAQIGTKLDESRGMAYEQLYDATTFSLDKISSKFLLKRHDKLPEFVKNPEDGKLIRVYETGHDATVLKYSVGMAKFLATMEVFPEFANLKGFKKSGAKKLIAEVQSADPQAFEWVNESFERRIGVGQSNPFEITIGATQKYANILAKVGLSAPTSGFKNIITGTAGTAYAFELTDIARGLAGVIKGEGNALSKTGAHQIGTGHYESGKVTEIFDKAFFRWGLMKPTERFNRNLVQLASKYDQRRMIDAVKSNPKGSAKYERANDRLKDFYDLSKNEIDLMQKYGFENNVDKANFSSTRDFLIEQRALDNALQKANTMAHVKTQGASIDLFMPHFASGSMIKPLTLYKRMAYAATVNTAENITRAYKSKDYGKLLVGSLATYTGGYALMGLYSGLLGQAMPKENSEWWRNVGTVLWKGEMLGLLSEFFSPYGSSINGSMYPAVYSNAGALAQSIGSIIQDKKFVFGRGQALDSYLRKTINLYNTGMKVIEKRSNPYNRDMIRMKSLWKDYNEDVLDKGVATFEGNELTKYKLDLRNAFNLGTEEEFTKTYMTLRFALAADYMKKGYAAGKHKDLIYQIKDDPNRAFKAADTKLKDLMTDLNPNPSEIREGQKIETKLRRADFVDWVLRNDPQDKRQLVSRMKELEGEYWQKRKSIKKSFGYHLRKMNMGKLAKEFNF